MSNIAPTRLSSPSGEASATASRGRSGGARRLGLRQVLAEMVLPEYVEIEFERAMKVVFSDVA